MSQEEFENACSMGDAQRVRGLLKSSLVNPCWSMQHPLAYAIWFGHEALARELILDGRLDPSIYDNVLIKNAASTGLASVVRLLLDDPRVDPSAKNNCAIHFAIYNNQAKTAQLLLTDSRVNAFNEIPLAKDPCARILAADPRCGIHAYPELYTKHHPELVAEYEHVRGQSRAIVWLMRYDNLGAWEGVAEPLVERLQSFLLY